MTSPLEKFQRREYYRITCMVPMIFMGVTEEAAMEGTIDAVREKMAAGNEMTVRGIGTILDISGGGARFVSEEKFEANQFVLMELELISDNMDKQYHIKGRIVGWKKLEYREPRYETRIEFIMEDNKVREDIIRYIFEEERKKRRNEKG